MGPSAPVGSDIEFLLLFRQTDLGELYTH
jgi:hypothetical protein